MVKKNYEKLCKGCVKSFIGPGKGICPLCGSTEYFQLDRQGAALPSIGHETMRRVIEDLPMDNGEILVVTRRMRSAC